MKQMAGIALEPLIDKEIQSEACGNTSIRDLEEIFEKVNPRIANLVNNYSKKVEEKIGQIISKISEMFDKKLTEDDLKSIIIFYSSPTGQKMFGLESAFQQKIKELIEGSVMEIVIEMTQERREKKTKQVSIEWTK